MTDRREPFFHRRTTHRLIRDLATPDDWTIYIGSGATIDRTGLSWYLLVDRLLSRFEADPAARRHIIERYGYLGAATMVHQMYDRLTGDSKQMHEDIQRLLYGPHGHMNGQMLGNVVDLAVTLADAGSSAVLVTPNYDDYLAYELILRPVGVRFAFMFSGGPEAASASSDAPAAPITCRFIHGFLPRRDFPDEKLREVSIQPVFSEPQYFETYQRSFDALRGVFQDRNVLLLGTSLNDAPLVNALLATADSKKRRVAVLPLQSSEFKDLEGNVSDSLVSWSTKRLNMLRVAPIYPDYFGQVGQLIHEIQKCMECGDGTSMTKRVAPRRYGTRLVTWWNQWKVASVDDPAVQTQHHELLHECVSTLRSIIGASEDESLKLELWVRWYPENEQKLALWASSVGTWKDTWSMRKGEIKQDSEYRAVRIFCAGAPQFMEADDLSGDRWRTYLATPIWHDVDGGGSVPVGVISLASMENAPESSVVLDNLQALDAALEEMRGVGSMILGASAE